MLELLLILIVLYGLIVGSFLNAWIWRTKNGIKISRGRSMCPHCKHQLKWYELIPVVSWLGLKGKCRSCKKPISLQYPLVELANALLWVVLFMAISPSSLFTSFEFVVWASVGSLMLAAFVYDLHTMMLPDRFTIPAIVIALLWLVVRAVYFGEVEMALQQAIGTVLFAGSFWFLWRVSGGSWLGDGDIRLAILMGLLLTTTQLVVAIFLSFNIGAIVGVGLIMSGKKTRKDPVPFGPFLITGLLLGFLLGDWLVSSYLQIFL